MTISGLPRAAQLVLLALLFYAGVKASLLLAVLPEVMVMLWLPNGLLLAALLRHGFDRYAQFAALILLAEVAADYPTFSVAEAALFGATNLLEVTLAFLLLRRWRFNSGFEAPIDLVKFLVAGPIIGALVAACAAAAVLIVVRETDKAYLELLRVWWFSDATGLLIVTPLALSLWKPAGSATQDHVELRWFDGVAAALALAVIAVFTQAHEGAFRGTQIRPILLLPLVLYAAARFNLRGTTAVTATVATVLLLVVRNGQQPFGKLPTSETVLQAQVLIFLMSVTSLGLAALLSQLRATTRELEARVRDRTAELRSTNEHLKRLTVTDPLTGVFNRRALFELMQKEIARESRHPRGLCVLIFDIDHFKAVNDRHGHAVGDRVLRQVAEVASSTIRKTDSLARYGGEEFVVVAPETDEVRALHLAERIRAELGGLEIPVPKGVLKVTASVGVALRRNDEDPEQLLNRADRALYAAKASGRDNVVMEENGTATGSGE